MAQLTGVRNSTTNKSKKSVAFTSRAWRGCWHDDLELTLLRSTVLSGGNYGNTSRTHPADGRGEMMTDADLYQLLCKLELAAILCWVVSSGLSLVGLGCWVAMKILENGP